MMFVSVDPFQGRGFRYERAPMLCPDCEVGWDRKTSGATCWCCGRPGVHGYVRHLINEHPF